MRFGWLAAAAAMVCAAPAGATTWVQYAVLGSGIEQVLGGNMQQRSVDFRLEVTVETDAETMSMLQSGPLTSYSSNGSLFTASVAKAVFDSSTITVDASRSGAMSIRNTGAGNNQEVVTDFTFTDPDGVGGLPLAGFGTAAASGNFSYIVPTTISITGRVTQLSVVGVVAGYQNVRIQSAASAGPGSVPEPASWALMIVGASLTGAALRRRPRFAGQLSEIAV